MTATPGRRLRRYVRRRRLFVVQGLSFLTLGLFFTLGRFEITARIAVLMILVAAFGLGITLGGTANAVYYRWVVGVVLRKHMDQHVADYPDCPAAHDEGADVIALSSWPEAG